MRLLICGVRGSTPSPGADFLRYGGDTSCVAVCHDHELPALVLDAGTGLQRLNAAFGFEPFRGTILLGHLHWDHTHGIPFFPAGDHADAQVRLLMPAQGDAEEVIERVLSPPHFPIDLEGLEGDWEAAGIEEGEHQLEGFTVVAREIPHKGGRAFGYRVSNQNATFAYLSDHGPIAYGPGPEGFGPYHDAACELVEGAELLIHDAQYTAEEFQSRSDFGHSAVEYPIGLARECGVPRVLLFHHDPARTDDELDEIVATCVGMEPVVEAATEGTVLELGTG